MKRILSTLEAVYQENFHKRFAWQLTIKGYMCNIFADILNNTSYAARPTATETEKMKRIRLLLSHIAQNYMHPVSLSDLAALTGLSNAECSRFSNSQMNQTPFAYLNQYRIERSCELLVNTDIPISEIALRTGFNSFSYYSKRFRELMHCTPSEYREKIRNALQKNM